MGLAEWLRPTQVWLREQNRRGRFGSPETLDGIVEDEIGLVTEGLLELRNGVHQLGHLERTAHMKTNEMGSRVRAVLRDLVVLISGILLALAGDALWEARRESAVELGYLESIRDDLSQIGAELDRAIAADSTDAAMNFEVVDLLRSGERGGAISYRFEDVSFSIGTIQALIGSGDIGMVSSPELRAEIVAFHAIFEARLAWSRALETQIIENVRESVRAGEAERVANGFPLAAGTRRSSDFVATVVNHSLILGNRVALHRRLRAEVIKLDAALDRELT